MTEKLRDKQLNRAIRDSVPSSHIEITSSWVLSSRRIRSFSGPLLRLFLPFLQTGDRAGIGKGNRRKARWEDRAERNCW